MVGKIRCGAILAILVHELKMGDVPDGFEMMLPMIWNNFSKDKEHDLKNATISWKIHNNHDDYQVVVQFIAHFPDQKDELMYKLKHT